MTELPRRHSPFPRIVISAAILLILGYAVLTSGIFPRDQRTLRISAQGPDTVISVDNRVVVLKNRQWPDGPLAQTIQVAGWTGSAACPNPTRDIGAAGYVYVNYNGKGSNEVTIGTETINLIDRGRSILVNGKPTVLPDGTPLVFAPESRPAPR